VDLDRSLDPPATRTRANPTVQVVVQQGDQRNDHQGGNPPAEHELVERQGEQVVGEVAVEDGVGHANRRTVDVPEPRRPLSHRRRPGDRSEDHGDRTEDLGGTVAESLLHALNEFGEVVIGGGDLQTTPHRIGHHQVREHEDEEDRAEDQRESGLHPEELGPDATESRGTEPHLIGPDRRQRLERGQHDDEHHPGDDEPPTPSKA